jgi:hypothetical protein
LKELSSRFPEVRFPLLSIKKSSSQLIDICIVHILAKWRSQKMEFARARDNQGEEAIGDPALVQWTMKDRLKTSIRPGVPMHIDVKSGILTAPANGPYMDSTSIRIPMTRNGSHFPIGSKRCDYGCIDIFVI